MIILMTPATNFYNSHFQDFIDVYLHQMKKDSRFDFPDLIGICTDLFVAGADTVSATLAYILMFLALYPDEQEKCFLEISTNLGRGF